MNDLATLTAQPVTLSIDGEKFQVHPLSIDDFGALQAWVNSRMTDPFAVVHKQIELGRLVTDEKGQPERVAYTPAQQQFLYKTAMEIAARKYPIGTPEADELLRGIDGAKFILYLSIRKGDPSFTEADADRICRKLSVGDISHLFSATTVDEVLGDPKAEATGTDGTDPSREPTEPSTGGGPTTN